MTVLDWMQDSAQPQEDPRARMAREILEITQWSGGFDAADAPIIVERVQAYCLKILSGKKEDA